MVTLRKNVWVAKVERDSRRYLARLKTGVFLSDDTTTPSKRFLCYNYLFSALPDNVGPLVPNLSLQEILAKAHKCAENFSFRDFRRNWKQHLLTICQEVREMGVLYVPLHPSMCPSLSPGIGLLGFYVLPCHPPSSEWAGGI